MKLTEREKWLMREATKFQYTGEDWLKENESQLAADAPNDWISVKDRLPANHGDYLTLYGSFMQVDRYSPELKVFTPMGVDPYWLPPTHWMFLPSKEVDE